MKTSKISLCVLFALLLFPVNSSAQKSYALISFSKQVQGLQSPQ